MRLISRYCLLGLLLLFAAPLFASNLDADENHNKKEKALYWTDFNDIDDGDYPLDFLILEGDFSVREIEEKKVLELPGSPLSDFGLLFGPARNEDVVVTSRIRSEALRRTMPRFGVGLCGVNGFKLYVTPGKRNVELYRGREIVAEREFEWASGEWTYIRLQLRKLGDENWIVEGSAWMEGEDPPENWLITYETDQAPLSGRPSIWGAPYSGRAIQFDCILFEEVEE